ncbi:uncharacterized protein LOC110453689 isoform X2 [Mizuhopecten yessoensis]|uniref:uncharacterized protein LOC110453689 isoform X2 n=1 Tax=Mizuhopecten yessoensis TaxID=6573 RepID=UPI000B458685|nr:uncharacterized protein LOC110453689 isoform X2 [Mizuhopecten yessoensis]
MDFKVVFWIGFLSTCMVTSTVDSVIPDYMLERAKFNPRPRRKIFRATSKKCCKIGVRTAKKKLSCTVDLAVRNNNFVITRLKTTGSNAELKRYGQNLAKKINSCRTAGFGKVFEKCCKYREDFRKSLQMCKVTHRKRTDKRKCRRDVKRRHLSYL